VVSKFSFKSLHFEIKNIQMTSDGEMTKTKDVDLEEQYNFVVDNLFI
jgi:hypothetical protein